MDRSLLLILILVMLTAWCAFLVWYINPFSTKPSPKEKRQFLKTFGYWPTANVHLKKLQQQDTVDPLLRKAAWALDEVNQRQYKLLGEIREGRVIYSAAYQELPRLEDYQAYCLRQFNRLARLAKIFGFETRPFLAYITKETDAQKAEDEGWLSTP